VVLSDGIVSADDIVADVKEQRLFWIDSLSNSIESVNYDGSQRRVVYKRIGYQFFALALDEVIFKCIGCLFQCNIWYEYLFIFK